MPALGVPALGPQGALTSVNPGAALAASVLSGLTSSSPAGPAISGGGQQSFSDRNMINIAPVGFNLGEILRNWEGPVENGGQGLVVPSRWSNPAGESLSGQVTVGGSLGATPILLIAAAGAAVLFFWKR